MTRLLTFCVFQLLLLLGGADAAAEAEDICKGAGRPSNGGDIFAWSPHTGWDQSGFYCLANDDWGAKGVELEPGQVLARYCECEVDRWKCSRWDDNQCGEWEPRYHCRWQHAFEKCDMGCKPIPDSKTNAKGRCLSLNDQCHAEPWTDLDASSPVCPLNGAVAEGGLPLDWVTTSKYMKGGPALQVQLESIGSDARWFEAQMEKVMFQPLNEDLRAVKFNITHPRNQYPQELSNLAHACKAKYSSFACMRNLPFCHGNYEQTGRQGTELLVNHSFSECMASCKVVDQCLIDFYNNCTTLDFTFDHRESYAKEPKQPSPDHEAACLHAGDAECWEPWCKKESKKPFFRRDCTFLCTEFTAEPRHSGASSLRNPLFWAVGLVLPVFAAVFQL